MKTEIVEKISAKEINDRIAQIAEQINKDYEGKALHIICILKGSLFFTCELSKHLTMPVTIDFISVSSYGDSTTSSGSITVTQDLTMDMADRHVLVIEDIVDSGRTLAYLSHMLSKKGPASLKICTLLDKPDRRVTEVDVDYTGFVIEDFFVVGFGLDYAQKYRNLPYIGELQMKED